MERISPWIARRIIRVSPVIKAYVKIMGRLACPTVLASGSSHSVTSTVFSEYLTSVDKLALEDWLTVDVPSRYKERSPASGLSKDTMEFA